MDRTNTTSYQHPQEPNLLGLHNALQYNDLGQPVVRTTGSDVEFGLSIASGTVEGRANIHKFGAVPEMSVNTTGSVWDRNDTLYPWDAIDNSGNGSILTIDCVFDNNEGNPNTAEDGKTVTVIGLDANFEPISEDIAIVGSSGTGTTVFRRVYRAYISGETNTARVLIKAGGTVVCQISENKGQTLMAIYTVPAGKNAFLFKGATSAEYSADATIDMFVRYASSGAFRIGHSCEVSGAGGPYIYDFPIPGYFPPGTDIDIRATTRSNNGRYTAAFDIILIDIEQ